MPGLGFAELVVILLLALLLFGADRLPKIARSMGNAITEFKKGMQSGSESDKLDVKDGDKR
ncbi:MAG: twin-arginine translocase TatA/TatE family subunit [Candidatus Omnitrophica bacterium]|nr:twin-arginine translocase TatA/TatE family subunit [Candidatus Omnitrophota bacterium]